MPRTKNRVTRAAGRWAPARLVNNQCTDSELLFVRPHLVFRNSHLWGHRVRPEYAISSRAFGITYIDRTKTLDLGFPYQVIEPLPEFDLGYDRAFNEIVDERAKELLLLSGETSKPLVVFWSGGIDSTLALCALLNNNTTDGSVRVIYSPSSIEEYPLFFKEFVQSRLQAKRFTQLLCYDVAGSVSVTGELGDQVFGLLVSILDEDGSDFSALSEDYRPWLADRMAQAYQTLCVVHMRDDLPHYFGDRSPRHVAENVCNYLEEQFAESPADVKTVHDLLWWIQISLKWQAKQLQDVDPRVEQYDSSMIAHFFNSRDFQLWSFANYLDSIHETWQSYKWQAKEYIRSFTGDDEYARLKTKHNSKQHVVRDAPESYAVRREYKALTANGRVVKSLACPVLTVSTEWLDEGTSNADRMKVASHNDTRRDVTGLDFSDTEFGDADMFSAAIPHNLHSFFCRDNGVTDKGLARLAEIESLEVLSLGGIDISDDGLVSIAQLPVLWALGLSSTRIGDSAASTIGQISGLQILWLDNTLITDKGLGFINRLCQLRVLSLRGNAITDVGLEKLAELGDLQCLYLDECNITVAGIDHLTELADLRILRLCSTSVGDSVTHKLSRLKKLRVVDLSLTNVTPRGVCGLASQLPQAQIYV